MGEKTTCFFSTRGSEDPGGPWRPSTPSSIPISRPGLVSVGPGARSRPRTQRRNLTLDEKSTNIDGDDDDLRRALGLLETGRRVALGLPQTCRKPALDLGSLQAPSKEPSGAPCRRPARSHRGLQANAQQGAFGGYLQAPSRELSGAPFKRPARSLRGFDPRRKTHEKSTTTTTIFRGAPKGCAIGVAVSSKKALLAF